MKTQNEKLAKIIEQLANTNEQIRANRRDRSMESYNNRLAQFSLRKIGVEVAA